MSESEEFTEKEKIFRILEKTVTAVTGQTFIERLSVQEYVDELRNCLEGVIFQLPCYVYWKDKDFKYTFCNQLTADIMGLRSPQEAVGRTDYDFGWDIPLADEFRKADQEIMQSGKPRLGLEETLIDKNGNVCHLLVNKRPLHNNKGEIIGTIGIAVDITAQKEAQ